MARSEAPVWPTTAAQKGIWLGQKLSEYPSIYNTAEYVCIQGLIDLEELKCATQTVLANTQAFNVCFGENGSYQTPIQKTHAVQLVDFSEDQNPTKAALRWMKAELQKKLSVDRGDLVEAVIIKLQAEEQCLYLKAHHIVADGFSYALVINQILDILECKKHPSNDRDDYLAVLNLQQQYLASEKNKNAEGFWREKLLKLNTPVSFSKEVAPIAEDFFRSEAIFDESTRAKLSALALSMQASWIDVLVAVIAYELIQRTGVRQVSLGLPVMARENALEFKTPLMSMNIIPLIIDVNEGDTLSDLVKAVSQNIQSTRPVSRFRYETLKALARKSKGQSGDRLWGPVVNIMPFVRRQKLNDCLLSYHNLSAGPVEDISFGFISRADGKLQLSVDANLLRYTESDIRKITSKIEDNINECECLLDKTVLPCVQELSWLEGDLFNNDTLIVPDVYQQLVQWSDLTPQAPALVAADKVITYRELILAVEHLASDLSALGIKKGGLCALALPRGYKAIVALLSCIKLNVAYLFLDLNAPVQRNKQILEDCKPSLLIREEIDELGQFENSVTINSDGRLITIENRASLNERAEYQNTAYLIYTSGSTGKPKGVMVSREALNNFVDAAVKCYGFEKGDRVLQFSPLHFDACIEEIFCSLYVGATLYLRTDEMSKSLEEFQLNCENWSISIVDVPTAFWHEMTFALHKGLCHIPSCIRTVIIGGEAVKQNRLQQWLSSVGQSTKLFNSYGPTEATVVSTVEPLHKFSTSNTEIALGAPLSKSAVAIVDQHLNVLPKGQVGELLIVGACLANGYLNMEAQTQKVFVQFNALGLKKTVCAYRSGDLAQVTYDGQLIYLGRMDDQVKISGHRIDPSEIETAIESLSGITEAKITVVENTGSNQLAAHIGGDGIEIAYSDITQLNAKLSEVLPAVMLPCYLYHYELLPRTSSGKIDKKSLSAWAREKALALKSLQSDKDTDLSELDAIKSVWIEILGLKEIDEDDDFFAIGGQSLQVIQLANRLSELKGAPISAAQLFANPTLNSMHNLLLQGDEDKKFSEKKSIVEADCVEFKKSLTVVNPKSQPDNSRSYIVLTGVTGFVGAHLLSSFLQKTKKVLICLARFDDENTLRRILKSKFFEYGLYVPSNFDLRVIFLKADFQQADLGMDYSLVDEYFSKASHIIHCAAITSVTRDYSSLRQTNALATGELLKLSKRWAVAFRLVSTIALAPGQSTALELIEEFIDFHSALSDGYQQSKWVAESFVQIAQQQNVDVRIYRLGRVVGRFDKGYVNKKDLVWQLIMQSMSLAAFPDLNFEEPWTAANEVADFIALNQSYEESPAVLNLLPDGVFLWQQALHWLNDLGYSVDVVSMSEWCEKLKSSGDQEALALMSFFEQKFKANQSGFETQISKASHSKFSKQLKKQGQSMTVIDKSGFQQFMKYATEYFGASKSQFSSNAIHANPSLDKAINGE